MAPSSVLTKTVSHLGTAATALFASHAPLLAAAMLAVAAVTAVMITVLVWVAVFSAKPGRRDAAFRLLELLLVSRSSAPSPRARRKGAA